MENIKNLMASIISDVTLSDLLVGSIGAVVVLWIGLLLIYSVQKMYKKMKKKIGVKGVTMYRFKISDDGKTLNFLINNESLLDDLMDFDEVFKSKLKFNFDIDLMREFNQLTEPYRKKYPFFRYFLSNSIDNRNLINFTNRLQKELRSVTRQQFERMTEEERENLSLKFAIWVACSNVLQLSRKKGNDLRVLRKYETKGDFIDDESFVLEKSSDSPGTKQWLEELTKKLITEQFGLLTSFLLESYFQAKIIKLNKTTEGVYIYIPVQFNEKMILTIFMPSSALIHSAYKEQKLLLTKIVKQYQLGYKTSRILGFVVKKGLVRVVRKLLR